MLKDLAEEGIMPSAATLPGADHDGSPRGTEPMTLLPPTPVPLSQLPPDARKSARDTHATRTRLSTIIVNYCQWRRTARLVRRLLTESRPREPSGAGTSEDVSAAARLAAPTGSDDAPIEIIV